MPETRSMTTKAAAVAGRTAPGCGRPRLGLALLVIATGVSHWGDAKVVAALAAAVVLLAAFAVIEARSKNPPLPVRLLADRNRTGAYLIMLGVDTALFGMFFLTLSCRASGAMPR